MSVNSEYLMKKNRIFNDVDNGRMAIWMMFFISNRISGSVYQDYITIDFDKLKKLPELCLEFD